MVNKVILIGNVGVNPESRTVGGALVADFPLATNESYKDKAGNWQKETEWHNIVCWRDLADRVVNSVEKGKLVYVEGKIKSRIWNDSNGGKHRETDIIATMVKVIGASAGARPAPQTETHAAAPEKGGATLLGNDLPF